jgi:hypothetical protein
MTFRQPCDDMSVEIFELERTTGTSLTSGCFRLVSLDRDYSQLSIRASGYSNERAPEAPSRGKPVNSFRVRTWVRLNPRCTAESKTRLNISVGVLITVKVEGKRVHSLRIAEGERDRV